jgi:DNA-binding protein HU-beta
MNKQDLISAIAEQAGMKKTEAKASLEVVLDTITKSLIKGEDVKIVGFGSWVVQQKAARKGRNPQTGEEIQIPAKKVVKFKVGKDLAEGVNN